MATTVSSSAEPGRARRVLASSTTSSTSPNIRSPPLVSSKPIRARVDLASLASPPASPALETANWTPTQPVRVKAKPTFGVRSAPTTPTIQSTGPFKSTPTSRPARAALSPVNQTAVGGSARGARAPSPQQRARSPDAATARTRTTSRAAPTTAAAAAAAELRGQRDPFPSKAATSLNHPALTPITHLPSSVSVRKLHSPSLRASQRQDREREPSPQRYLSTATGARASSSSSTSSILPPLSTSPSSVASSPLTSPHLASLSDSGPVAHFPRTASHASAAGLGFYDPPSSLDPQTASRKLSGASSISTCSSSSHTNGMSVGALLPAFPSYSSSSRFDSPLPFPSPALGTSFVSVTPAPLRSPTLPCSASTKTLRSLPASTSTSHLERSTQQELFPPSTSVDDRTLPGVEWSTPQTGRFNDDDARIASDEREEFASPRLAPAAAIGIEGLLRESIEKEIEAKVSRRIMDLEIRTSSLLSINAQLERQKQKQTLEIRELRRKLRESLGGVGPARRFDLESSSGADEYSESDNDDDDEHEPGGGHSHERGTHGHQSSWEELLEADKDFGKVVTLVDGLIQRGRKAIEYTVDGNWDKGRVLSTVEMEDRFEQGSSREASEASDDDDDDEGSVE
ncbi:uncharacterized protein JCM15063_001862 [Sporobolomyces koalae]|uniref:uncharacterized protein n=1 Tax=Sporobolomyces koalae TaxID=500713 RepID=UPI00317FD0D7